MKQVTVTAEINLIVVVGIYMFTGVTGVFSFGHISFMAIGAYSAAFLTIPPEIKVILVPGLPGWLASARMSPFEATILGGLVAAGAGLVIAIPLMRVSGITAGLGSFAILIIVYIVASNWDNVTKGAAGLSGIPFATTRNVALVWAIGAITLAHVFQQSRWGLSLRASREDEVAASAAGIRVAALRRAAFVLSAFVVGVGGALFAQLITSFNPTSFYLDITFLTLAMLVVGGVHSLAGAVMGTIVLSGLSEFLRQIEQGISIGGVSIHAPSGLSQVGLAVVLIGILAIRPSGLTGGKELRWPPWKWARRGIDDAGGERASTDRRPTRSPSGVPLPTEPGRGALADKESEKEAPAP